MKFSSFLHFVSAVSGILGFIAMVGAWLANESGEFAGFFQDHLFSDATVLYLLSITAGIGVLIHRQKES